VSILSVDNLVFVKCMKLLNIIRCLCMLEHGVACYWLSSIVSVSNSLFSVPVILKESIIHTLGNQMKGREKCIWCHLLTAYDCLGCDTVLTGCDGHFVNL
jgi:hypothetical protein